MRLKTNWIKVLKTLLCAVVLAVEIPMMVQAEETTAATMDEVGYLFEEYVMEHWGEDILFQVPVTEQLYQELSENMMGFMDERLFAKSTNQMERHIYGGDYMKEEIVLQYECGLPYMWNDDYTEMKPSIEIHLYNKFTTSKEDELRLTEDIKSLVNSGELSGVRNQSTYEKVRATLDYVKNHVNYSTKGNSDPYYLTCHSAFYEKQADCRGMALLVYRILRELNIPVRVVYGRDASYSHLWNLVYIDGHWYNCDADMGVLLTGRKGYPKVGVLTELQFNDFRNNIYNLIPEDAYDPSKGDQTSHDQYYMSGAENWQNVGGTPYWYEGGDRQGTYNDPKGVVGDGTVRGREIYDPISDGWYWLDAVYEGAKAINKEVWMPYIYQDEKTWDDTKKEDVAGESGDMRAQVVDFIKTGKGKWVRYDVNGKMVKGWYTVEGDDCNLYPTQVGNTYYYDYQTGLMAKGKVNIDGKDYFFDEVTGALQK